MPVRLRKQSWYIDFTYERVRYRKRSPHNSQRGAQTYELTFRMKLARGEPVYLSRDPRTLIAPETHSTFVKFARHWLETYVKINTKPSTQHGYGRVMKLSLLPWFGMLDLTAITTPLIEEFKAERIRLGNTPKTVNNHLIVLRRCLSAAYDRELIQKMPRVQWLKTDPPAFDFLTSAESARLLAHAQPGYERTLLLCALRTGLRAGELAALRWEDVNFDRRVLTIRHSITHGFETSTKSHRIRHVPISTDLEEALRAIRKERGFVFGWTEKEPKPYSMALRVLYRTCKRAGMRRIGLHVLRHSFASQLAAEGIPLLAIQMLLGHSTIEMTQRYAHLAPSYFTGVVNVLVAAEERDCSSSSSITHGIASSVPLAAPPRSPNLAV